MERRHSEHSLKVKIINQLWLVSILDTLAQASSGIASATVGGSSSGPPITSPSALSISSSVSSSLYQDETQVWVIADWPKKIKNETIVLQLSLERATLAHISIQIEKMPLRVDELRKKLCDEMFCFYFMLNAVLFALSLMSGFSYKRVIANDHVSIFIIQNYIWS